MQRNWLIAILFMALISLAACTGSDPESVARPADDSGQPIVNHLAPAWSPTAATIAHVSTRGGNQDIWALTVDDGATDPIRLSAPNIYPDRDPAWSADGDLLAYAAYTNGLQVDLWVVERDGTNPRNLSDLLSLAPDLENIAPVWSHSGNQLAFTSRSRIRGDIVLVDVDTLTSVVVTEGVVGSFIEPTWSYDDDQLAFIAASSRTPGLWVADADGTRAMQINDRRIESVLWSPTQDTIAFTSGSFSNVDLFLIAPDGTNLQNLTADADLLVRNPVWSPDGTLLAFEGIFDRQNDIWTINADGTGLTNLTNTPNINEGEPSWSGDSMQIAFISNRDTDADLWIMDADGDNVQNLTGATNP